MKHIHILGICGTFMGGLALLAREAGFKVTGCDANVYPPMSTQLEEQGIELISGFDPNQVDLKPDVFVIGNVVSRGNPLMEAIMDKGLPYISGPQWLGENILHDKWVLAVSGTHGKTTTSSMLAWILEDAGLNPGFLVGGVLRNFGVSARLSPDPFFVIEADEYDTSFFDKRSKFVHYRPRTLVINNLEFDHADIFDNLAAIQTQFHHLVRTIPQDGLIINNKHESAIAQTLERGVWSTTQSFGNDQVSADWQITQVDQNDCFHVRFKDQDQGQVKWDVTGEHNRLNALSAIAAARHVGVVPEVAIDALSKFKMPKRRMEVTGSINDITIYDDFAHHPTAIAMTISGLRKRVGKSRIIAVLEPRSNTMKMGVMKDHLIESLKEADCVFAYEAQGGKNHISWSLDETLSPLGEKSHVHRDVNQLIESIVNMVEPSDHILIMSNGSFEGIHKKLLNTLKQAATT